VADVFISFIHLESNYADCVSAFLSGIFGDQIKVFQSSDRKAIYAGEEWMKKIFDALQNTKVLISMMSPESVTRPWINFEAGAAWMRGTPVIPICFNGLTIADLPKPYSSLQAVEVEDPEQCYYLADSIAHHLGLPQPAKPGNFWSDATNLILAPDADPLVVAMHQEDVKQARLNFPYRKLTEDIKQIKALQELLSGPFGGLKEEDRPPE
jgi:hypothetical protein